jgi:peptidoglycan/LPS O-acetylase OafA/YrhL
MPGMIDKRRNGAMWSGFLLALGAWLCNVVFFANFPGQRAIPWLSVLLAVVAIILLAIGLWRVFGQPRVDRGKILSSILSLVSLLLAGVAIFAFFHARALPPSSSAPQVGQKAPNFTLADTTGHPVSLDQLFAPAAGDSQGIPPPRAVLLIFYRGYW